MNTHYKSISSKFSSIQNEHQNNSSNYLEVKKPLTYASKFIILNCIFMSLLCLLVWNEFTTFFAYLLVMLLNKNMFLIRSWPINLSFSFPYFRDIYPDDVYNHNWRAELPVHFLPYSSSFTENMPVTFEVLSRAVPWVKKIGEMLYPLRIS